MRNIIIGIVIILGMVTTASAAVRPGFIEMGPYGLEPATWMAAIVVICAFADNIGRAWDKKQKDPEFNYNYAYLNATIIASTLAGLAILGMDVVELGLHEILTAIILGFGGNLTVKKATRGTR